ncbi:hypothetical protein PPYR_03553 [Photinus pyralis]|uniref:Cytosolic Fe-S cluster assembly factor NUBP2 homolog n=1 Tax=Photinus pyralis TaxID=7054 RepID=A0A5N4A351_PHOPY|nr:cytosolic Fe-S cluster assembly factor NUBP2 homolog [Photinus pyralis]KAB0791753.1 hypothetical protein PPYR_03553 [Photinus pyralis]
MIDNVKHIILVVSGKGGVGKSTFSTQFALALKERNLKVGLLDIDLCGPSIPYLLNLEDKSVHQHAEGWLPVYTDTQQNFAVMSIGFLLNNRNSAVVWRGPKKTAMVKQFLNDVHWGDLDYLIIDTPPGTSDEHITVMENLKSINCDGAIVISSPQEVAIEDVRKEITFCNKTGIPIIGLVENLSGYACPHCSECTNIFSTGGAASLAEHTKIPLLGTLPIDPKVGTLLGKSAVTECAESQFAKVMNEIVDKVTKKDRN